MDKVIFGDNQFFGVNHRSESKANCQTAVFKQEEKIFSTLAYVNDIGIKSFMFTTHDRFEPIFKRLYNEVSFNDFKLYPCMPYAHKYAEAMVDMGLFKSVNKFLKGNKVISAGRMASVALTSNPVPAMKMLIDSELMLLRKNNVHGIFMQNIVVDLILGLGVDYLFAEFSAYVEKKYGIAAGFITMNHARLADVLVNKLGLEKPIICSAINKIGFRMNPSQVIVEESLCSNETENIAMSILASGAIAPHVAVNYISELKNVRSVLFGASSHKHILETKLLIDEMI